MHKVEFSNFSRWFTAYTAIYMTAYQSVLGIADGLCLPIDLLLSVTY